MILRYLFIGGGIFTSYCIFAILQERLFKRVYGEGNDEEKFTFVLPLLCASSLFNFFCTLVIRKVGSSNSETNVPPFYFFCCALATLLAMISSYMSLFWVSYPTQIIAKAAKPVPVMIMGVMIGHKTFPISKYFFVLLIVFGVSLFLYKDGKAKETNSFGIGEVLLLSSLMMDGLFNSLQERLMSKFKTNPNSMMMETNKWATLISLIIIVFTNEGLQFLYFISRHPSVTWHILLLCITGALGQFFIYKCVIEFGTLPCSIITTTRKFFSVLGSVIIFTNELLLRQWFGVVCVFSGLFLDVYYGKLKKVSK